MQASASRTPFLTEHLWWLLLVLQNRCSFVFFLNRCSCNILDTHKKISMLKSLFNTVRSLKACNFNKKETPTQEFSCEYHKIFKNSFFIEHLQWLLLSMVEEFLEEFIKEKDLYRRSIIWRYEITTKIEVILNTVFMQPVISSRLNLEKTIFKPENKTINDTNDHLWRLKFAEYCVQEMKKLCRWGRRQEAQVSINREKGKRE